MKSLSLLALAALAAVAIPASAQGLPPGSLLVRPLVGIALTGGGETLADVQYQDGSHEKIRSGGLVDLYGGLELHPVGTPFAVQATLGYHFDTQQANNGDLTFSRVPFEVLFMAHVAPQFRLGAGLRYATNVRLSGGGAGSQYGNNRYEDSTGFIAKAEWMWAMNAGIELRYVDERYKLNQYNGVPVSGGPSIDGSHVGIGLNYYFR